MMVGRSSFLCAVLLLLAGCAGERPVREDLSPRVDVELSAFRVKVGEPFTLGVTVFHPEGRKVEVELDAEAMGLRLLDRSEKGPERLAGGLCRSRFVFELAGYVPGPVEVGPVEARIEGLREPLRSSRLVLEILDPLGAGAKVDLSALRPEKGPVPVPARARRRLVAYALSLAVAALAACGGVLWVLLRRRRPAEERGPTPYEAALAALAGLLERIPAEEDLQAVYYEAGLVLRRFIEECYGIRAARQTTEEFLEAAREGLASGVREGLEAYLAHCDMVKYARLPAGREEAERAVKKAREFVERAWRHLRREEGGGAPPGPQPQPAGA